MSNGTCPPATTPTTRKKIRAHTHTHTHAPFGSTQRAAGSAPSTNAAAYLNNRTNKPKKKQTKTINPSIPLLLADGSLSIAACKTPSRICPARTKTSPLITFPSQPVPANILLQTHSPIPIGRVFIVWPPCRAHIPVPMTRAPPKPAQKKTNKTKKERTEKNETKTSSRTSSHTHHSPSHHQNHWS